MSDVRIYDHGLSQDEVLAVMAGGGLLPPGATPGDFNQDGVVDTLDFQVMAMNFNQRFTPQDDSFFKGDFDTNLRVDLRDFLAFREVFLTQPEGAAVPEPTMSWPLALSGLLLLSRRRRSAL